MTNNQTSVQFVTPIQYAKMIGKQPQQVYGWLRENKVPAEAIHKDAVSGKQYLNVEMMNAWFATRQSARTASSNSPVMMMSNPNQILEMMVTWFRQAKQDKIADSLDAVLTEIKAGTENQ